MKQFTKIILGALLLSGFAGHASDLGSLTTTSNYVLFWNNDTCANYGTMYKGEYHSDNLCSIVSFLDTRVTDGWTEAGWVVFGTNIPGRVVSVEYDWGGQFLDPVIAGERVKCRTYYNKVSGSRDLVLASKDVDRSSPGLCFHLAKGIVDTINSGRRGNPSHPGLGSIAAPRDLYLGF